jgi:hypothetical protein
MPIEVRKDLFVSVCRLGLTMVGLVVVETSAISRGCYLGYVAAMYVLSQISRVK